MHSILRMSDQPLTNDLGTTASTCLVRSGRERHLSRHIGRLWPPRHLAAHETHRWALSVRSAR
jgi:hypothetical protein